MVIRRRIVTGDEQDVHTRWRHALVWRRGEVRRVKRTTNRRERREGKADIRTARDRLGDDR